MVTREEAKIRECLIENIENEKDGERVEKQCHQLLRMGKKWKDDKAVGCAYYYLALNDMRRGRYRRSIENVQDAMPYLKKSQDFYRYTRAFNTQGISYSELGNEVVALESYLDGMDSARENHIPDMQVYFYNNIASRFQEVKEHKAAISYLDRARKYFSVGKRKERFPYSVLMIIYMNLGSSYTYLGEYEKAEEALRESMKIAEENQDDTYRFSLIYLFSTLYWRTGKKEYAYEHLDELVEMAGNGSCIYDYTQNITEFIELLTEMEEYGKLEQVIGFYEAYAKEQDSIYLYITAAEFRLAYYERLGEEEKY